MTEPSGPIILSEAPPSSSVAEVAGYFATSLRGTWRAMNAWGDEVERKHFNGDFLGTVKSAPKESITKIAESIDNLKVDQNLKDAALLAGESVQEIWKRRTSSEPIVPVPVAKTFTMDELQSHASELQVILEKAREAHPVRHADIVWFSEEVDRIAAELNEEESLIKRAERERSSANVSLEDAWREIEDLQEKHHALLSRRASLEAEIRRESLAASLAARADKQARQEGMDPETEALKDSKVLLAEVLTLIDEARLQSRKELSDLQQQIAQSQTEHAQLTKANSDEDFFATRRGLFSLPF